MAGALDGPDLKVERAKKHLRDLEAAIQGFFQTNPYEIVVEDNSESNQRQHRVARADPVPPCLSLIAGDAIHNARSALDLLVCELVRAKGGDPEALNSAFPVWRSKAKYEAGRPGYAKGVSKPALDLIYGLKPYKGGNDALWRLHQLNIVDKHRLLLTLPASRRNVIIDFGAKMRESDHTPGFEWIKHLPDMPIALSETGPPPVMVPGLVLFGAPLGDKEHDDVKFTVEITLDEPKIVEREPLGPTLQQLVSFAEGVINLFRRTSGSGS